MDEDKDSSFIHLMEGKLSFVILLVAKVGEGV